jgi:SAM-dependent methyltransferase
MDETIHFPSTSDLADRIHRTKDIIGSLNISSVADIGGADYYNFCNDNSIRYISLNLEEPQKTGTGGYHKNSHTITYDGITLPLQSKSNDLVIVNFVLHHAPDEALRLLNQIRDISKKYVLIGEDVAGLDHEINWHVRNFQHQPGGLFRSDKEWQELFKLYKMNLRRKYIIHRNDDPDPNKIYRCLYLLEV